MKAKAIELADEQIEIIIDVLREKLEDLDIVLKNMDGLDAEAIRNIQLQHRDISEIIRELQFYTMFKDAGK